jgi:2-polyprenyl-3-methyl-5-hydroxy-6-metoxy-1,4-benzoquinol methylase
MNVALDVGAIQRSGQCGGGGTYYMSLYDPSFLGRRTYVTVVGSASVVTSEKAGIEWNSWSGNDCAASHASQYFVELDSIPISDWGCAIKRMGRDNWSVLALLHAEQRYRSGAFESLREICLVIEARAALSALSSARKLKRAADALGLLRPAVIGEERRGSPLVGIIKDAVRYVQANDPKTFGVDLSDFVKVETPVRVDFESRRIDFSNEQNVVEFYKSTHSYILELTAANHQVETLSNYQCCLDIIINRNKKRLYDYGGGIGTLALLAQKRGIQEVTMADLRGPTLSFARERAAAVDATVSFEVLEGNGARSLPDVDVVCCTEVVEHVFEPECLLRQLTSVIPSDGLLIVSESFDYTDEFCTHLAKHRGKGGIRFIEFMTSIGFRQLPETAGLHCQVFERV